MVRSTPWKVRSVICIPSGWAGQCAVPAVKTAQRHHRSPDVTVLRMSDLDLHGQRVLIREDLNVPIDDHGRITSTQRLDAALPTIRAARDAGAKVMVLSHLGRPKEGQFDEASSLAPVAAWLGDKLGKPVQLVRDYLDGVEVADGEVVVLENCR